MRKTSLLAITALLLISVLTSGCIFNFGAEKKINKVLDQYEKAMIKGDSEALVSLIIAKDYIEALPENDEEEEITITDDHVASLKAIFDRVFTALQYETYKIENREITVTKDKATVEAKLIEKIHYLSPEEGLAEGYALEENESVDEEQPVSESVVFELQKVGSNWKVATFKYID